MSCFPKHSSSHLLRKLHRDNSVNDDCSRFLVQSEVIILRYVRSFLHMSIAR